MSPTKPKAQGKRTDIQPTDSGVGKYDVIKSAGFTPKQVERFETLAAHPEIVEQAKAEARNSKKTPLSILKQKRTSSKRLASLRSKRNALKPLPLILKSWSRRKLRREKTTMYVTEY